MSIESQFTFADLRRIRKVFSVLKNLAEHDNFFAEAVEQFVSATGSEKIEMCNYLLDIYNSAEGCDFMTLEEAVMLSAYPA